MCDVIAILYGIFPFFLQKLDEVSTNQNTEPMTRILARLKTIRRFAKAVARKYLALVSLGFMRENFNGNKKTRRYFYLRVLKSSI